MSIHNIIYESEYRTIGYDKKNALPHHDNSIEIIQFWSDGGHFIVRNNFFPIKPGLIVLISAMDIHYSNPSNISKYNRSKIIISTECFRQICTLCDLENLGRKLGMTGGCMFSPDPKGNDSQLADSLFDKAFHCFSNSDTQPTAQASIIDCVIQILALFEKPQLDISSCTFLERPALQMMNYINTQLLSWEDVSLNSICEELHISRSYAAHLFKQLTNKSITRYVMDLRISEAKKLLLTTALKVSDIADLLKFKDSTTFCKTFKKHTGHTPRTYRMSEGMTSIKDEFDV